MEAGVAFPDGGDLESTLRTLSARSGLQISLQRRELIECVHSVWHLLRRQARRQRRAAPGGQAADGSLDDADRLEPWRGVDHRRRARHAEVAPALARQKAHGPRSTKAQPGVCVGRTARGRLIRARGPCARRGRCGRSCRCPQTAARPLRATRAATSVATRRRPLLKAPEDAYATPASGAARRCSRLLAPRVLARRRRARVPPVRSQRSRSAPSDGARRAAARTRFERAWSSRARRAAPRAARARAAAARGSGRSRRGESSRRPPARRATRRPPGCRGRTCGRRGLAVQRGRHRVEQGFADEHDRRRFLQRSARGRWKRRVNAHDDERRTQEAQRKAHGGEAAFRHRRALAPI